MTAPTFRLTSLGCAKNFVDSEGLAGLLARAGWRLVVDGPADLVVVNTCAFIEDAAQESVNTLLAEIDTKRAGDTKWLAAVGCLPQKYDAELAESLPEVDIVLGAADMGRLVDLVGKLGAGERVVSFPPHTGHYEEYGARLLAGSTHSAYLKIAEGCDNACHFCIIGRLRGPFRSRAPEAIVAEARSLVLEHGAVELNLVAQDLTRYGLDLTPAASLIGLLAQLDPIAADGLRWLRLLYAHPARVDRKLLEGMAAMPTVAPYLDMPLQHFTDRMLRRMGRPQTAASSRSTVALVREVLPEAALRTTFLVGHPGETDADFAALLDFVAEARFEHLGAFGWSSEEGTPSHAQDDWVPEEVRDERLALLLEAQQAVSRARQNERVGAEVEVLVEEVLHKHDDDAYSHVGRIAQQAPEVDGVTYLRAPSEQACQVGRIVRARVTLADTYDLFADLIL
jgi:ribosomal protein S12 methylthiotransferase